MPKIDFRTFFAGGNAGVQILKRGELSGGPYATARGRTKEIAQRRAGEIADALNVAEEYSWVGDGPSVAEAGEDIHVRGPGGCLFAAYWGVGRWVYTLTDRPVTQEATGWRRMPKAK